MSITLIGAPVLPPGSCKLCGSGTKEWFIDMGHSEEFHGAIYYCCECIAEVARVAGFFTPDDQKRMLAKIEELEAQVFDLTVVKEGLEQGLDGLLRARFVVRDGPDDLARGHPGEALLLSGEWGSPSGGAVGEGAGDAPEPSDDEPLAGLRRDDSGDDGPEFRL